MEKSSKSEETNGEMDRGDTEQRIIRETPRPVSRPIESKRPVTNIQFLETKLENCFKFLDTVDYLRDTALLSEFKKLTSKEVLEWVIWIHEQKKTVEEGLHDLFAMHKLDATKLKKEEYEKFKLYFVCFYTIAFHK